MKVKKVAKGNYEVTKNGVTYEINKEDSEYNGGVRWKVTAGEYSSSTYWTDCFNTKAEAVQAVREDGAHDCTK